MKTKAIIMSVIITALSLSNCDVIGTNLFESIDKYQYNVSSSMSNHDIAKILNNVNPDDLSSSDVAKMSESLQKTMSQGSTTDKQEAALLMVDLKLSRSEGNTAVNNVPYVINTLLSDSSDIGSKPSITQELFTNLLGSPSSIEEVADLIDIMTTVEDALAVFNVSSSQVLLDMDEAALSTLVQQAIVVTAISMIVDIIKSSNSSGYSTEEAFYILLTADVNGDNDFVYKGNTVGYDKIINETGLQNNIDELTGIMDSTGSGNTSYQYLELVLDTSGLTF
ncbi:hypothetical protein [Spirochaeta cellobiosiphila]|uniref:hypothetical protein n=1 Tax=Spirochaeta cellobiosiphila TaxID=504483 RepID=UPI000413E729|nr:hypothetical protein [Spirochaeta cellobiosiphila]